LVQHSDLVLPPYALIILSSRFFADFLPFFFFPLGRSTPALPPPPPPSCEDTGCFSHSTSPNPPLVPRTSSPRPKSELFGSIWTKVGLISLPSGNLLMIPSFVLLARQKGTELMVERSPYWERPMFIFVSNCLFHHESPNKTRSSFFFFRPPQT